MKGFIAALILLAVVGTAVGINANFVKDTQAVLSCAAENFSVVPSEDTVLRIKALREQFDEAQKKLSLSVNFYSLDRISELLASLEAYAATHDASNYAATLQMLRDALQDLSRLEQVAVETLF